MLFQLTALTQIGAFCSLLFGMKCSNGRAVIRYTTHFPKLKWSRKRIQYYANSSYVFNLILNCGDIETNPGVPAPEPTTDENNSISNSVQTLCPTCNQNVNPVAGLFCDSCKYWWHVKCHFFPRDRFILSVSSHTGWVCPKCQLHQNEDEFDVTTDQSLQATVHRMSSNREVFTLTNVPQGDDYVGGFNLPKKLQSPIIGHLNIRSIKAGTKFDELKAILLQRPTVHIISFSETWLDDSWTDDMLAIPNYSFVRCDRFSNIRGGGMITYIHKDVPYSPRHDLTTQTVESTCIEIKLPFLAPILITNVYHPLSADSAYDSELGLIVEKITSENKECFVLGDFNINLLFRKSNSLSVIKPFRRLGLKQSLTEPTRTDAHYTNGSFSVTSMLIDHIYVQGGTRELPYLRMK